MQTKKEFSTGGVVYKKVKMESGKWRFLFLLGKHSGYHKWVLPKGLIEEGEKAEETALRETEEEMGVKAKIVQDKPLAVEQYSYFADMKVESESGKVKAENINPKLNQNTRRVEKYQEAGGDKTKVFKTVTFYLMEYVSGDEKDHGWEMSQVEWFDYDKALEIMSFVGEKKALAKAKEILDTK